MTPTMAHTAAPSRTTRPPTWGRRGWAQIPDKYTDLARQLVQIFREELKLHVIAHPEDFDRRCHVDAFALRLAQKVKDDTGYLTEVTECILRDRQRDEDPPNTAMLCMVKDDHAHPIILEINDQM